MVCFTQLGVAPWPPLAARLNNAMRTGDASHGLKHVRRQDSQQCLPQQQPVAGQLPNRVRKEECA